MSIIDPMKLVIVSSALPRICGLATFTHDLSTTLRALTPWQINVCAIDRDRLAYGDEVLTTVSQYDAEDYRRAARAIAATGTDLVVIEHEFGIFGGPDGSYVLELADELRLRGVRYAVTLHTILSQPSPHQRATLAALCAGAARVTVFTHEGRRLALATGIAPAHRLVVVAHGAPTVLRTPVGHDQLGPAVAGTIAGLDGAKLVTTFGLVGPGKGLELGIGALAEVVDWHPDTHYLIAGTTHPDVVRREGEAYREKLQRIAAELGVAQRVRFLNRFLTDPELSAILARTDVFLTPYRSPEQICSGALTFALAAGRPVVSTRYRYAVEMLAPQRDGTAPGVIVPCDDTEAMAGAITRLFDDPPALAEARMAANAIGAKLTWPAVARLFAEVFTEACRAPAPAAARPVRRHILNLAHLDRMTHDGGIIQFATGVVPDLESGSCVDDMARLGIVAAGLHTVSNADPRPARWLQSSLRFLELAASAEGLHNMIDSDGSWLDRPHLGDHLGRAIWAAGTVLAGPGITRSTQIRALAALRGLAPLCERADSPRTHAYALLGITRWPAAEFHPLLWIGALKLAAAGGDDGRWPWYERILAYDNARLPQALLEAGRYLGNEHMIARALSTLDWYLERVGLKGTHPVLRLVGNGWRADPEGPSAHEGDEQPIDAAAVVEALVAAWRHTGKPRYAAMAQRAFAWFHGLNRAGVPLYDPVTGGCRDGLSAAMSNANQGAESTLAYYQALLTLAKAGLATAIPAGARHEPKIRAISGIWRSEYACETAISGILLGTAIR